MKQSFARQHSRHRNHTPSVICLPPPKPPVAVKRPMAAVPDAAITLSDAPEPLVTQGTEGRTAAPAPFNRQARRKAERAEAKAQRRAGHPPVPAAQQRTPIEPAAEPPVAKVESGARIAESAAPAVPGADAPLPRARSLAVARPRGLALFTSRLRVMFGLKPKRATPADMSIAGQLRTLRSDLAALQQSLDRMIDGVAA